MGILSVLMFGSLAAACAQDGARLPPDQPLPYYLEDRGPGMPTSLFGSYIKEKELLVYLFYEFTYDHNTDYNPKDLGFALDQDFQGRTRTHEELIFVGYGITDWLAVEMETAFIQGEIDKDPTDPSTMPQHFRQTGFDLETQVRARFLKETETAPELYGFFETDYPINHKKTLITNKDWILGLGVGAIKGFSWGTIAVRFQVEYSREDHKLQDDEYEIEYLKKLSDQFKILIGIEGVRADVELIMELQWYLSPNVYLKFNNGIGLTPGADDWAPEIGIMISF
jgi:hypothetical protein